MGSVSMPTPVVRRRASPPSRFTTHKSPAYVKAICVRLTAGLHSNSGPSEAVHRVETSRHTIPTASFFMDGLLFVPTGGDTREKRNLMLCNRPGSTRTEESGSREPAVSEALTAPGLRAPLPAPPKRLVPNLHMLNVYIIFFSQPPGLFWVCTASVPSRRRRTRLQVHLRGNSRGMNAFSACAVWLNYLADCMAGGGSTTRAGSNHAIQTASGSKIQSGHLRRLFLPAF